MILKILRPLEAGRLAVFDAGFNSSCTTPSPLYQWRSDERLAMHVMVLE
jgi:hypothetical protein